MKTYLDFFGELCRIPHGSGNTKAISDYCVSFARERGLRFRQDAANNVVIVKEATPGREQDPVVMLQSHLDMVAVKEPELDFDLSKDPLQLEREGDFLYARGTSLGGDDGIAAAYALAVLDSDTISHPRLECVFTTDEEIGMLGAIALDMSDLRSQYMINIDSELEGVFTVSCAGGCRERFHLPALKEEAEGECLRLEISGLQGGHSGTEIHKNRSNAILLMGRLLGALEKEQKLYLINMHGGSADNVIPSICAVELITGRPTEAEKLLKAEAAIIKAELAETEPGFSFQVISLGERREVAAAPECTAKLIKLLAELPNGVLAMSKEMEGMVETSSNLGTIALHEDGYDLICAPRSAKEAEKEAVKEKFRRLAEKYNAELSLSGDYPGWPVCADSRLVPLLTEVYREMFGKEAVVEAIHAGLECGVFSQRMPQMDIVSMGPNLYDIHSTKERLSLSSAERVWRFLLEVLHRIH